MYLFRLGKADRAPHQPLNPGPQIDMLALDFLGVVLAHLVLLSVDMPLVGTPTVRVIHHDTKGFQQRFELEEDLVLAPSKHIRQLLPRAVINGVL
jgi:hypothetical protein